MFVHFRRVESESKLMVIASETGVYTCMGCNGNCEMSQVKFFVTTLPEGFHIEGPTQAIEGDAVELLCAASKYNYTDNSLVWYKQIGKEYGIFHTRLAGWGPGGSFSILKRNNKNLALK